MRGVSRHNASPWRLRHHHRYRRPQCPGGGGCDPANGNDHRRCTDRVRHVPLGNVMLDGVSQAAAASRSSPSRSGRDARQRKKDEARRMTLTMACVQCPCSLGRHDPRCGPLPGKKSKARLWTSASLWTYAPLYPLRPEAAAPTFTLLSRFAPVRGLVISSQTFACNNRATWTADHFSPGGAGMPRSSRPAAMARSDPHNRTP
jgi:hypothetical protein